MQSHEDDESIFEDFHFSRNRATITTHKSHSMSTPVFFPLARSRDMAIYNNLLWNEKENKNNCFSSMKVVCLSSNIRQKHVPC
jgi:hypothetical protein